jgi:TatD DNase family protein
MMIDCHAHLSADLFDADRDDVRRRAQQAGVAAIVVVGEDLDDDRRVERVCAEASGPGASLVPAFGLHPDRYADDRTPPSEDEIEATMAFIRERADRMAAIGEVGLDRWWVQDPERRKAQEALLERWVALSEELGLALNVHSRSAGRHAVDLLIRCGARRVLLHAFDGKASHAVRAAEAGYVLSIPASVVRSQQKQKLVRRVPVQSLALETDSPVLGPERGQRNEPANAGLARDFIAEAHGLSPERVEEITSENARRLFPAVADAV